MEDIIKISVRNLIEFVMRSGDIDNSFMSMNRALEGTLAHQKVQKSYDENYKAEVYLKYSLEYDKYTIILEGRADGILMHDDKIVIDEIKSTTRDLETLEEDYNVLHWAQVKCYAFIYSVQNDLEKIDVQLTYFNIETEKIKKFIKDISKKELQKFFYDVIEKYIEWANLTFEWGEIRNSAIATLDFPFPQYRKGQRELAVATYKTIKEGKKLFVQAPTGIGKTMSTLFPSIKAMGEGNASKIFYLTAKTITRQVPISSMELLREKGLRAKTLVITAKDKICLNDKVACNPRECQYAKGHYDRVNDAIMDIIQNEDLITRDIVISYSEKHKVCPFEFSLDISLWCDVIICDYNYVFDPQVYLKRFFEMEGKEYVFLIDEAHNLVDRSREMFSASINKADFMDLRNIFKEEYESIYKSIGKINTILNKIKKENITENNFYQKEAVSELYYPITKLISQMEVFLIEKREHPEYDKVLEFYFGLITFIKIFEFYDEHYVTSVEIDSREMILRLYCVDSSYLLSVGLNRGIAAILFSATLTPLEYHRELLGGNVNDYHIKLSSPFPRNNLCLLINNHISTKYKDRDRTYLDIVENIEIFVNLKKGNYFIFFPSYVYMKIIYEKLIERNPNKNIIMQNSSMTEIEREEFLSRFDYEEDLIAFVVMGGIFSEGIDLVGEKLIGAVIVGVGMPQISFERDIIKDYFNSHDENGFDYSYVFPGMNKVLQAAGRVIRSEEDKGAILLIDDRYNTFKYKELFPQEWLHFKRVLNQEQMGDLLEEFWNND